MGLDIICAELNNYFIKDVTAIHLGDFEVKDGMVSPLDFLKQGQWFRIIGSDLNDGVYLYNGEPMDLKDEVFNGAIWAMSVPPIVLALAADIDAWREKNEALDSENMSPYSAESFDGYSYSKGGNSRGGTATSWQSQFADRLKPYRRLYVI
jgi:hypothetical protein